MNRDASKGMQLPQWRNERTSTGRKESKRKEWSGDLNACTSLRILLRSITEPPRQSLIISFRLSIYGTCRWQVEQFRVQQFSYGGLLLFITLTDVAKWFGNRNKHESIRRRSFRFLMLVLACDQSSNGRRFYWRASIQSLSPRTSRRPESTSYFIHLSYFHGFRFLIPSSFEILNCFSLQFQQQKQEQHLRVNHNISAKWSQVELTTPWWVTSLGA